MVKSVFLLYLWDIFISFWSIQNRASDAVSHTSNFSPALCDPQHFIGCLVIQSEVKPV